MVGSEGMKSRVATERLMKQPAINQKIDQALHEGEKSPGIYESVFQEIFESLSIIEKIVYEAVPIEQPARIQQVIVEVRRANKTSYSNSILESALSKLVRSGVVAIKNQAWRDPKPSL
jgi:hypothetical protein